MSNCVQNGDLLALGAHRVLCGDSSDPRTLQRIVGRRRLGLVFASPPYYNQRAYSHWPGYDRYLADMASTLEALAGLLAPGGAVVWLIGRGSSEGRDHAAHHSLLLERVGLRFQDAIAWVKPQANYASRRSCHIRRNGCYYPAFRWETLLVYRKPGRAHRMGPRERRYLAQHHTDVWEIARETRQMRRYGHPSICPVEIPRRCMLAYLKRSGYVLDPFAGSGTTLIAAEETGRAALLVERKAEYCEIAIRRWEQATGGSARKFPRRR